MVQMYLWLKKVRVSTKPLSCVKRQSQFDQILTLDDLTNLKYPKVGLDAEVPVVYLPWPVS